jgi:hypothetical protein
MFWGFRSQKYNFSKNAHNNFEFLMVEENIYRIRTAINQPLTERDRKGRKTYGKPIMGCGLSLRSLRNGYVEKNR